MANTTIQLKYSVVASNAPSSLANGEIAINGADGKLFYRTPSGTIQSIVTYPGPAGLNKEVQFNDAGVAGSSSDLTFDKTSASLNVTNLNVTTRITTGSGTGGSIAGANVIYSNTFVANSTTTSNSTTTGALIVAGGAGIAGNVYAGAVYDGGNRIIDIANSKTYTFEQNTAPATANVSDRWVNIDTGVEYHNFGNTSSPVWAEVGPTGVLSNTAPGAISASSINVSYTPATTTGSAVQVYAANTIGGTGYADVIKITNSSVGTTNPNKSIRLNTTGGLEIIDSNYGNTIFTLTDSGDLSIRANITSAGIQSGYNANRPAFRVTGNGGAIVAAQTVQGGYYVVDYNQGSYLNTTNGIFTAPVAGLYQVNLVIRTNSNSLGTIAQAIVRKTAVSGGAVTTQIMVEFGPNTSMNHVGGSTIVKLAVGDTLKLDVTVGTLSWDGNDNWSVAYIG